MVRERDARVEGAAFKPREGERLLAILPTWSRLFRVLGIGLLGRGARLLDGLLAGSDQPSVGAAEVLALTALLELLVQGMLYLHPDVGERELADEVRVEVQGQDLYRASLGSCTDLGPIRPSEGA